MKKSKLVTTLTLFGLLCVNLILAQTTVSGSVIDSDTNAPIPGVNIIIQGTTNDGTNSDFDGNFSFTSSQALPFTIDVSSVGFASKSIEVTSADQILVISLDAGQNLDEIIVSASRRPQKLLDAPASVSIITAKDIERNATAIDPVRHLMNIPGVQIQQQSANTINIEMRAGASLFGTSAFPMLDYRFLVTPASGTFFSQQAGLSNMDIARIEVVRGAASALYGPGVTSGVVHFISKNPIDYPGTSIELIGGSMSTLSASLRHAYASESKKFGYKINAKINQGNDFELDGTEINNSTGGNLIESYQTTIFQPLVRNKVIDPTGNDGVLLSGSDLDDNNDGNPLATKYKNVSVNTTMEYRPNEKTSAFLSGGYAKGGALFFNSQGAGYQNGQDYWAQARVQSGGLFAQVFYNYNDGGDKDNPTFLYSSGFRQVAERSSVDAQVQYNFDVPSFLNSNYTVGIDHRNIMGNSDYTLYGRNDDDDDYIVTGIYAQGTSDLSEKLALTYAARFDNFNILDETGFSPRIALVYKLNSKNTFRASYNVATSPPAALQAFIDFPVSVINPGSYDVWLAGEIEAQNFAPDAPISLGFLGESGIPQGSTQIPNAILAGAFNAAGVPAGVTSFINAPGSPAAALTGFAPLLESTLTSPAFLAALGASQSGLLGSGRNIFDGTAIGSPQGTPKAILSTMNSFEVGYKGIIGDKFTLAVDVYTYERVGFTQFTGIGPTFSYTPDTSPTGEFATAVGGAVQGLVTAPVTAAVTSQYQTAATALAPFGVTFASLATSGFAGNAALGVDPVDPLNVAIAKVVGGLAQSAVGGYFNGFASIPTQAYSVFGTVQSLRAPGTLNDGVTHAAAGYRKYNNAKRSHYGIDIAGEYFVNKKTTLWANGSYVSQNKWIPGESNDDGLPFQSYLNTPQMKARAGLKYASQGYRYSLTYQHDGEFDSDQGVYRGTVQEKNLIDTNLGYDFGNGFSLDLSATNLFDQKYRAFPGMPIIGRRVLLKALINL